MQSQNNPGLKENWKQFTILVIVNAFVGGMIGMERSIFPQFAESEFGISSKTAILSFITAFGLSKAISNYFAGKLANSYGRKNILLFGWLIAIPIPFMLMYAQSWTWVIFANLLLGLSQGLTWSSTVVMKIDLVGDKERGLAMGLNEFAGYFSVGLIAYLTGLVAHHYGITPYPFYIGICISVIGFIITALWVHDTRMFVHTESARDTTAKMKNVFLETTFKNKTLSSVTQAGLINNLNDGMIWGLLPIVLISMNYNNENIGTITAIYPTVWGISQLFTGKMSDHFSKKEMLFWGMLLQGLAILLLPLLRSFYELASLSALLGIGTAMVYPTFLSTIAQATSPGQRAESIGTFRLWRDLGYAIGAILSGIVADFFGMNYAILSIGGLTLGSSLIIRFRMPGKTKASTECMEIEVLKQALQAQKNIQIIDVRSKEEYEQVHIPQAIHIPLQELKNHISNFSKDIQYVTTSSTGGGRSAVGAQLLKEFGFHATWLCGGTKKWIQLSH